MKKIREKWQYRSSREIVADHPVYESAGSKTALDNTNESATAEWTAFDADIDEVISADSTGVTVNVTDAARFVGETGVEVQLDSGAVHLSGITSVDTAAGTVTITVALPSQASEGRRVRATIGATKNAMAEFGTRDVDTQGWGFYDTVPSTHESVLHLDRDVDYEVTVTHSNIIATRSICATIVDDC